MTTTEKKNYAVLLFFLIAISFYFLLTIPSNSIWRDQFLSINLAKDILNWDFPLVGYLHSNKMHSFPAFYYFVTPLVYISDNPLFLYGSVAIINTLGILCLTKYIHKKFGFKEVVIFLFFSATHSSSLFFSSFFWNPNYIPFFMSMFIITLFKYLNSNKSIVFFHFSGIILNIMVQMMPQSIVLIPTFILILVIFKKLPSILNQISHIFFQFILVYPWLHYHFYIFEWEKFESGQKLYKGFTISIIEYLNFLGGWVLNSEYTTYLAYGTNTYPYTVYINLMLKTSSLIILLLIIYGTYLSFRKIRLKGYNNLYILGNIDSEFTKEKCIIVLSLINFSCIFFFLTGMQMVSYHYQFLGPILALKMSLLVSFEKKFKKLLLYALGVFILIQGMFSYWRAYSEFKKPYVTDIGYRDKFLDFINKNCNAGTKVYTLDPRGLNFFGKANGINVKNKCGTVILVLRDHFKKSQIIRWFIKNKYIKTNLKFKDYTIWSSIDRL